MSGRDLWTQTNGMAIGHHHEGVLLEAVANMHGCSEEITREYVQDESSCSKVTSSLEHSMCSQTELVSTAFFFHLFYVLGCN